MQISLILFKGVVSHLGITILSDNDWWWWYAVPGMEKPSGISANWIMNDLEAWWGQAIQPSTREEINILHFILPGLDKPARQIVICICFWFKLKQNINKYLLLAEDPQEVLEPAYTRKDLIRTPHAQGSSGRLDPSLNKYWEGNTMAGRSAGEVWMRVGLVCFYCSSCTFTVHVCHKV